MPDRLTATTLAPPAPSARVPRPRAKAEPAGASAPVMEPEAVQSQPHRAVFAAQELRLISALVMLLGVGLVMALPFVLSIGSVVFLPLVAAIILSILMSPLADQLMRLGLPNALASMAALLVFLGVVMLAVALILQPALVLIDDVPVMVSRAMHQMVRLKENLRWVNELNGALSRLAGHAPAREVEIASPGVIEQVVVATPSIILETVMTLLMSFFMIETRVRLRHHLLLERSSFDSSLKAARVIRDIQDRVGAYILTVAVINAGVGVLTALGAWALGWNAPIMWGGLAALLNFIPYIGPLTMIGVLALVGMATYDTILPGLIAPLTYLGLHTIESNVVTPAVLGRRFTVNPVLILLSFSYFSWIWGVLGALLSVPILITLTALFEHLGKPNAVGFLFGEPLFPSLPEIATGEEAAAEAAAEAEMVGEAA